MTDEEIKKISISCKKIVTNSCYGCRYDSVKYDVCPNSFYAPELALALIDVKRQLETQKKEVLQEVYSFFIEKGMCETLQHIQKNLNAGLIATGTNDEYFNNQNDDR